MKQATGNSTMIRAQNVTKRFFTQPVLSRISFEVPRGGSFVVLGQSGVGKSVLLKILANLIVPDEGTVAIESRNIGMLFQKNALFDSLTVYENLDFTLRERTSLKSAERKQKIAKFLEWVGLPGTDKLFPDELSGGMQKRLGIARALIVAPEVLFYDEPTAGLDPITSRIIAELILRLKHELGTTIVVVTSDVLRAFQMADRIGLLMKTPEGAVLLDAGTPDEARAHHDEAIQQFLRGKTKGPLTAHPSDVIDAAVALDECGINITERMDVDYF